MKIPVLVFRVKGNFAHWRKWFTTTSSLTYSFPPRTAIIGLIGAILGIKRGEISSRFPLDTTRIALSPLKPIVKDYLPQNWYQNPVEIRGGKLICKGNYKMPFEPFQANLEVIRDPCYRVIFWHKEDSLMGELAQLLQEKRWFYPPYLGILGFLADVDFEAEDKAEKDDGREIALSSVLPLDEITAPFLELNPSRNYIREERIPLHVLPGRRFQYLEAAYIEATAQELLVSSKENEVKHFHLENLGLKVMFLEP